MKTFAQFYQRSPVSGALQEACGDRSLIILDGRQSLAMWRAIAAEECERRKYVGYRIMCGTILKPSPVSDLYLL